MGTHAGLVAAVVLVAVGCGAVAAETPAAATVGAPGDGSVEVAEKSCNLARAGARLRPRVLVGADGSRIPLGWWDDAAQVACEPRAAADGTMRCLPAEVAPLAFRDDMCAEPVTVIPACRPVPPLVTVWSESADAARGACLSSWRVYHTRPAPANDGPLYKRDRGGCRPGVRVDPGDALVELDGEVDPSEWIELLETTE